MTRDQQIAELFRITPRLKAYCRKLHLDILSLANAGRPFTADDIYQEAVYKALRNWRTFTYQGEDSYLKWMFKVAKTEAFHMRRPKIATKTTTMDERQLEAALDKHEQEALDWLVEKERQRNQEAAAIALASAIDGLPANYGLAVLYGMDGKTSKELEAELGVNWNTLRFNQMVGREKLATDPVLKHYCTN